MNTKIGAVVLAAGKGKRMKATEKNKVVYPLANKPMILHSVELLEQLQLESIVIVVGFAKESVMQALEGKKVTFVEQKEQLGTAHAVECGIGALPKDITDVLVIQGDDSALYTKEVISSLIEKHVLSEAAITFLSLELDNPSGLGRVLRDSEGKLVGIIEEKDADENQKKVQEINPACYIFSMSFLKKYIPKIEKSPITGEYYLTGLIDISLQHAEKIEIMKMKNIAWRGVNTPEELEEAEALYFAQK